MGGGGEKKCRPGGGGGDILFSGSTLICFIQNLENKFL